MPKLSMFDIFPEALLAQMLEEKYVAVKQHDTEPLRLYGYTPRAAYERVWNDCTRACRGLIVDQDGFVVARPFAKFFNIDEPDAPKLGLDSLVYASDKRDGSLGIVYPTSNGWAVATRGSFHSEQATHATARFQELLAAGEVFPPEVGVTDLYEVIYPANRIVLDYGSLDTLMYIGSVSISSGKVVEHPEDAVIEKLSVVLARPPRENAEGLVITCVDTGAMVKLKQADYQALHGFIGSTTARTVWEFLGVETLSSDGLDPAAIAKAMLISTERVEEIIAAGDWRRWVEESKLPDFFKAWISRKVDEIKESFAIVSDEVEAEFASVIEAVGANAPRADFANEAKKKKHRSALFMILDDKPTNPYILRAVYPEAEKATAIEQP